MSPLPRRLRSFSLRTLMALVGVVAAWFAWERYLVRERTAAMATWRGSEHVSILVADEWANEIRRRKDLGPLATVPWTRRKMGDVAVQRIWFESAMGSGEIARARRLFPEALVFEVQGLPR